MFKKLHILLGMPGNLHHLAITLTMSYYEISDSFDVS